MGGSGGYPNQDSEQDNAGDRERIETTIQLVHEYLSSLRWFVSHWAPVDSLDRTYYTAGIGLKHRPDE
jgi:hypothetical protein